MKRAHGSEEGSAQEQDEKKRKKHSKDHNDPPRHEKNDAQEKDAGMMDQVDQGSQEIGGPEEGTKENGIAMIKERLAAIKLVSKIAVPTLNLQTASKPFEIIQFVRELDKYRTCGKLILEQILTKALIGEIGQAWCMSNDYNYEQIRKNLLERLEKSHDWVELKVKMESGMALSEDLDMHIARFKEIAYARGLDLENEQVKEYFVKSMPPAFHPRILKNSEGQFLSFSELEHFAQEGKQCFEEHLRNKSKEDKGSVAAMVSGASVGAHQGAWPPFRTQAKTMMDDPNERGEPQKQSKFQHVRCHLCHRWGHIAKDCWKKKKEGSRGQKGKPDSAPEKDSMACAVGGARLLTKTECRIDDQNFSVALDTGSSVNAITEEAAARLGYIRDKADHIVEVVGSDLQLKETMELHIDLGDVHTTIEAFIVPSAPVDILIGQDFLRRYSKGFNIMVKEFTGRDLSPEEEEKEAICTMETKEKLE